MCCEVGPFLSCLYLCLVLSLLKKKKYLLWNCEKLEL